MAHIKIDYDGLMQQASALNNQISQYEALGSKALGLMSQMQSTWKGESCDAYIEMMQGYLREASKMTGVLQAFKEYAEQATRDFSDIDQQCAALINNSF
jgi:WXG100 family type VII secretion target